MVPNRHRRAERHLGSCHYGLPWPEQVHQNNQGTLAFRQCLCFCFCFCFSNSLLPTIAALRLILSFTIKFCVNSLGLQVTVSTHVAVSTFRRTSCYVAVNTTPLMIIQPPSYGHLTCPPQLAPPHMLPLTRPLLTCCTADASTSSSLVIPLFSAELWMATQPSTPSHPLSPHHHKSSFRVQFVPGGSGYTLSRIRVLPVCASA